MAVFWIFVVALGSLAVGEILRSRGKAILDKPGGFVDRRLGHLTRPPRHDQPAGGRSRPSDSRATEVRRRPDAGPAANDHDDSQPAGGSEVDGEWSLLIIPVCVCAVLLFVSAVGGLPGG
jgi:hypothetical protein